MLKAPDDTILSPMPVSGKYALFYLVLILLSVSAAAGAGPPIDITFRGDEIGKPPQGWGARNGDPGQVYIVQSEEGKKYLHAAADGVSVAIGYEKAWPLGEYPVLQWQWRAVTFPSNSDERKKSGSDSALGLYVVFGRWPFIKSIKYIWSDTLPEGETFNSPFASSTKEVVVRSGRAQAGMWITERRDVLADYRRLFGENKSSVARGIAILTDSDNTHSRAVGDYGFIKTLPQ